MEIVRRVVLVVGLMGAVWCAVWPRAALIRVSAADFAGRQKRRPKFFDDARLPLGEYIARQTEDRLVQVDGPAWEAALGAANAAHAGELVGAAWGPRLGTDYARRSLYFRPDEAPVSSVAAGLSNARPFTYVALPGGAPTRYLSVNWHSPREASGHAPTSLLYPRRRLALWVALAALALYIVLPWPRVPPGTVRYSRVRGGVLPDVVGLMLTGVFFAPPLLIIPSVTSSPRLLDVEGGWIVLTLLFWLLAGFGLAIHAMAAWYTRYQIRVLADGLERVTLWGRDRVAFADIESVAAAPTEPPRWLVRAGFVMSLVNWRALGPTLLVASRSDSHLELRCRDGRRLRVGLTALLGVDGLLRALRDAGIALGPKLEPLARQPS